MENNSIEQDLELELGITAQSDETESQETTTNTEEKTETSESDKKTEESETTDETAEDTVKEESSQEEPATEDAKEEESQQTQPETHDLSAKVPEKFLNKDGSVNVEALAKSYTELQGAFSKKSKQVAEAPVFATPDEFNRQVEEKIEVAALQTIERALSTIQNPEQAKDAFFALKQYQMTGDVRFVEQARGFLDRSIDKRLEVELMNTAGGIKQQFFAQRDQLELQPVIQGLQELEAEDPEWLADEVNADILTAAIKMNRKVDVKEVKSMIKQVADRAVAKYKASESKKAAIIAEKQPGPSLRASDRTEPPVKKKSFEEMSIEEQLREEYMKN